MADRHVFTVGFQMTFGHIRGDVLAIDEHVVPGPVFRRAGTGDFLIPIVSAVKFRIDIVDHPAIAEFFVMHDLPDVKFGMGA